MEINMSVNSSLYEETITTDYATAHLLYEIHKETAVLINERDWEADVVRTYYRVSWRKGR